MAEEKKFLGTAGVQQLITNVRSEISAAEQAAKKHAEDLSVNYDAAGTAQTKVQELANGQVKTNTDHIGTMDNLETTAKDSLVTAINEVRTAVSAGGTAAAITMEEKSSDLGAGVLKAYVLKQGTNTVGTINIPKDMVVQSGEVVTNPEGQAAGTYIKLTLANATNDVIYVNVGTLVDIYKAKASAAQVQLAIDSATREISATIVAGSVTATELAANAVTTVKIADGNVTKAKLSTEVQASLDKADGAAQDATDKAAQALADAKEHAAGLNTAMNTRVEALEAIDHDHTNKEKLDTYDKTQSELLAAANTYADDKVADANNVVIVTLDPETGKASMTGTEITEAIDSGKIAILVNAETNSVMCTLHSLYSRVSAEGRQEFVFGTTLDSIYSGNPIDGDLALLNTVSFSVVIDYEGNILLGDTFSMLPLPTSDDTNKIPVASGGDYGTIEWMNPSEVPELKGIATNASDIDKLEASLATGGATANAIAEAKKAGDDAQASVDAITEITAADINAMFTAE